MESAFKPQSAEDIENRIELLGKSYAPEWKFDRDNPDAGTVIAQIFARQTEENNRLMSQMPERYHMEFVNMLDATLRPAQPAASMVVFNMDTDTVMGTQVPKGTRLTAESDKTESGLVVYETDRNLYVTDSRIRAVFQTDAERGTLSPIYGDYYTPEVVSGHLAMIGEDEAALTETASEAAEEEELEENYTIRPFTLFGEKENLGKSILVMYEEKLLDGVNEPIYIRFEGADDLIERIKQGKVVLKYLTNTGFKTFNSCELTSDGKTFKLLKDKESRKTEIGSKKYSVVTLEAVDTMTDAVEIEGVSFSAGGDSQAPEFVGDGVMELEKKKFAPFSDELAVFNECYIGHSGCFSKSGSRITLQFKCSYHENHLRISPEEEEAELAVIKLKPKKNPYDTPAQVKVDEIIIEYYNGIGWKKINCDTEYAGLFQNCEEGDYKLSFLCPEDWMESESGPYNGKCLRVRVIKAANCYMRPGLHVYPVIENLKISYSYEGRFTAPQKVERVYGTKKEDLTAALYEEEPFTVLSGIEYHEDALYIGFDKKLADGPISLYFQLSDVGNQSGVKCHMEYMGPNGFNNMRATDLTESFTRSGTVMFMPPADMTEATIEGNRLYWLRVVRSNAQKNDLEEAFLPKIARMCLNAVIVTNVQTSEEHDYYIEEAMPNLTMPLGADNILDAQVWVNEKGFTRKEEMDELLEKYPEKVRAEYDFLGRVSAFYVLWQEVDSFHGVKEKRCYRIDRMTGNIIFSDGTNCDMPRVTDDIAFKARIRSTDGEDGNLGEGHITNFIGASPYIDTVYNPIRAHGGSNLETLDHALMRCAGIMHSRYKLVSETDYIRFCMEFSDSIDKARVIVGETIEGLKNPADISIVLLMKDYADGSFSFHRIAAALKRQILNNCEVTVTEDNLHIVEPIFVEISVCVWAMVMDMDEAFDVQNEVKNVLSDYLDPVSDSKGEGWTIGTLPKQSQILMRLGVLRSKAIIQRITMVGHYIDATGEHELDTKDIEITPFMIAKSGVHKVIITNK